MKNGNFLGSNVNRIKAHNMRAILLSLLNNEPAYRTQLAKETSLSTTTITNLIDELMELGIVVEKGAEESEGSRRVGRPRTALYLVHNARYAVGVHIGVGTYRIAVTNLTAKIQHKRIDPFDLDMHPDEVLKDISANIEKIIVQCGVKRDRIIGVGVGVSGLVDYRSGVNILAPNLGWRDVCVQKCLTEDLNLPVVVDNNVRAMALGEAIFGIGREVSSLVFVYGRIGVGAGIVVNGQVFRGSDLGAGEIGHVVVIPEGGESCRCGNRGCLETLVSEPVLVKKAEQLSRQNRDSVLSNYLRQSNGGKPIEQIFKAAREGDQLAIDIIEQSACYLGIALGNLVNVLNPELILLGGIFAQGEDLFLPSTKQAIENSAFGGLGDLVTVRATGFGRQAAIIGAAGLALTTFFYLHPEEI